MLCHAVPRCAVQSEYGDLYKVSLEWEGEAVSELRVKYFDTIPPANALCVLRKVRAALRCAALWPGHCACLRGPGRCGASLRPFFALLVAGPAGPSA